MKTTLLTLRRYLWTSWIKPLFVAAIVVLPLKSAVVDWNWVPTGSMRPTILEGELVFINKVAYDLKIPFTTRQLSTWDDPDRGDVVVCFSPADGKRLVKRVVGLPGDRLTVVGSELFINGKPISYGPANAKWSRHLTSSERQAVEVTEERLGAVRHPVLENAGRRLSALPREYVVPVGSYFMMGDNRDRSLDSRSFGSVPREQIVGRASAILLSFDPETAFLPRLDRFFTGLL